MLFVFVLCVIIVREYKKIAKQSLGIRWHCGQGDIFSLGYSVAVLHICIWGGSRGGIGCARGGTKTFHIY